MRKIVTSVLVGMLAVAALAAPASAGGKLDGGKIDYSYGYGAVNVGCSFPVDYTVHLTGSYRIVATPSGGALEVDTLAEQDTFVGPGGTLESEWYHFRVAGEYDANFEILWMTSTGQLMTVVLPDGTVFRSAGIVHWDMLSDLAAALVPDHGLSGDMDAFCAALAG